VISVSSPQEQLPEFIEPMLASSSEPFDSPNHLFEIKWDGTRALCYVDSDGVRLMNRRRVNMTFRYPDLSFLSELPRGTILDGEIIVLKDGIPHFDSLQVREQSRTQLKISGAVKSRPARFIAFDCLYDRYSNVMSEVLTDRRNRARDVVSKLKHPHLIMSEGVTGDGRAYFQQAVERKLEGVMAKLLTSPYLAGKRNDCWIKIKRHHELAAVVIGFTQEETGTKKDFAALIVATPESDGTLTAVGKVGSGFNGVVRDKINSFLWAHIRKTPVVACVEKGGIWVEPELYCMVRCMERTATGQLRAPVFGGLYGRDSQ
jgi:bifunctional non-homologous end joining protein LigD